MKRRNRVEGFCSVGVVVSEPLPGPSLFWRGFMLFVRAGPGVAVFVFVWRWGDRKGRGKGARAKNVEGDGGGGASGGGGGATGRGSFQKGSSGGLRCKSSAVISPILVTVVDLLLNGLLLRLVAGYEQFYPGGDVPCGEDGLDCGLPLLFEVGVGGTGEDLAAAGAIVGLVWAFSNLSGA